MIIINEKNILQNINLSFLNDNYIKNVKGKISLPKIISPRRDSDYFQFIYYKKNIPLFKDDLKTFFGISKIENRDDGDNVTGYDVTQYYKYIATNNNVIVDVPKTFDNIVYGYTIFYFIDIFGKKVVYDVDYAKLRANEGYPQTPQDVSTAKIPTSEEYDRTDIGTIYQTPTYDIIGSKDYYYATLQISNLVHSADIVFFKMPADNTTSYSANSATADRFFSDGIVISMLVSGLNYSESQDFSLNDDLDDEYLFTFGDSIYYQTNCYLDFIGKSNTFSLLEYNSKNIIKLWGNGKYIIEFDCEFTDYVDEDGVIQLKKSRGEFFKQGDVFKLQLDENSEKIDIIQNMEFMVTNAELNNENGHKYIHVVGQEYKQPIQGYTNRVTIKGANAGNGVNYYVYCSTPNAVIHSISNNVETTLSDGDLLLYKENADTSTSTLYVYATADGYLDSEMCTVTINQETQTATYSDGTQEYIYGNFSNDTWEKISYICNMGVANKFYNVGDTRIEQLSTGENIKLTILDFNHDVLISGGYSSMTIGSSILTQEFKLIEDVSSHYDWETCIVRTNTLAGIILWLPSNLQSIIKTVVKKTYTDTNSDPKIAEETNDRLFLLSNVEINGYSLFDETGKEGKQYEYYKSVVDGSTDLGRINTVYGQDTGTRYWLRSKSGINSARYVTADGALNTYLGYREQGISFAFCI